MGTRAELVLAVGERYRNSSRDERGRILDEFVAPPRHHRCDHPLPPARGAREHPASRSLWQRTAWQYVPRNARNQPAESP